MTQRRFFIPSLLAAGLGASDAAQGGALPANDAGTGKDHEGKAGMHRLFTADHLFSLAQHRSHSSHSSHRSGGGGGGHYSHTSHRSSYGGGYAPAPVYSPPSAPAPYYRDPTPAPSPLYRSPSPPPASYDAPAGDASPAPSGASAPRTLSGRSPRFASIVRRVQIGLLAQGFYEGAIDGVVGPALRGALRRFQADRGIEATGTITASTLDALRVSAD